ncbi:MAG: hypothetical protein EAX81_02965 [Candidatus Thorarchaeota archaeon]|nr:hypothetical protein [Candidatus Thorarchaeota archaeon]
MRTTHDDSRTIVFEPETTPSILATIPDCLRVILQEMSESTKRKGKSILISSNSLANKFIMERWKIRPSQRKRYRNLFAEIRKRSRAIFQHYLARSKIEWKTKDANYVFGIFKFDEIRGNLILGFVPISNESEWTLPVK